MLRLVKLSLCSAALSLFASVAGCSSDGADQGVPSDENDLTSLTARSRAIEFNGVVYVAPGTSDDEIGRLAKNQSQSAFGPLKAADIAVNTRELKSVDSATFVKRDVVVRAADGSKSNMTEVRYTYRDNAVVSTSLAQRTSFPLALLRPDYRMENDRVLKECTSNDEDAREFAASIWYVFNPALSGCQRAIKSEEQKVQQDRANLEDPTNEVTQSEVQRLYIPVTASLGADKTNRGASYPDYHRLYSGGVRPGKLVIGMVYGMIDHKPGVAPSADSAFGEYMMQLKGIVDSRPGFKFLKSEPAVDLSTFQLPSGRVLKNVTIQDIVRWSTSWDAPEEISYSELELLKKEIGNRIYKKWLTIEMPVSVQMNDGAPRDFAISLLAYYGAESDATPHKYGIRNSDVFLYNGHSYIGFGPLDPKNFTASDFPQSYQILFIDSCVSYNYYEKDYIPLKQGGTKNLDLITNGIEAPSWRSGQALGAFVSTLIDGTGANYKQLLQAASATDSLRVVDGELDNSYTPQSYRIKVTAK